MIDPNNPALWNDGTPRSMHTGFTRGLTDQPIDWAPMQHAENMRRVTSKTIARMRADGKDKSSISGMSKKSDAHIRATKAAHTSTNPSQAKSKAQRLRDALASGPMTSRELAAVTGINMDLIPPLLQWDISINRVRVMRGVKPYRYALAETEGAL